MKMKETPLFLVRSLLLLLGLYFSIQGVLDYTNMAWAFYGYAGFAMSGYVATYVFVEAHE